MGYINARVHLNEAIYLHSLMKASGFPGFHFFIPFTIWPISSFGKYPVGLYELQFFESHKESPRIHGEHS